MINEGVSGRWPYSQIQTLTLVYTIFDSKGNPFKTERDTPFTFLHLKGYIPFWLVYSRAGGGGLLPIVQGGHTPKEYLFQAGGRETT